MASIMADRKGILSGAATLLALSALAGLSPAAVPSGPPHVVTSSAVTDSEALDALTVRLDHDATEWAAHGVILSSWGPDLTLDAVLVHLVHYTPAYAAALVARYGPALMVSTESQSVTGSDH